MFPFFGGLNGDQFDEEYDGWYSEGSNYRSYRSSTPSPIRCKKCGYYGLKWRRDVSGWGLAYTDGPLKDKLHACENQ